MDNELPEAPILLVDDEPANLLALEAVLQDLGEPLQRATSGEEAMRALRDRDFAAVLLDVHMPGMDGFETARLIRAQKRSRETPILFITADGSDMSAREAYELGAVDFLSKPLKTEALRAKLAFFVELHRSKQELKAAERQAVQDRQFLSAVLEAVEDCIVACDEDGRITLINRAARMFLGEVSPGMAAREWLPAEALFRADGQPLPAGESPLGCALSGRPVHHAEIVIAPQGRKPRTVLASGQALHGDAGRTGAVLSLHDVSAWREAESAREAAATERGRRQEAEAAAQLLRESRERLRESEERVRLATDAAGLGVWVWDADTDEVTWENERLNEIFGVPLGEEPLDSRTLHAQFLLPEDAARLREGMGETLYRGERLHFQGRMRRQSDGSLRWIEVTGMRQGGPVGRRGRILGTVADITERKRAEDELRASEERYRTLFESMDEGFCIVEVLFDAGGRAVDCRFLETNPAFAKQMGTDWVTGRTLRELVPSHDERWFELYGRVAATGESVRFEDEIRALGRWFDVYATRLGGAGSHRVAILFSDITQRRRSEDSLRRLAAELAESDRRKTEFLATLAHELRNPLAPISNGLHLMRMMPGDAQAQEKAREMMQRQLKHMVHLVDDLLDIARISRDKVELRRENLDLAQVLASAVETSTPVIHASQHELQPDISAEPMTVFGDATRIAQVVANLLNNAAKYTPQGGRIELRARAEAGQAVVSVRDTGMGIPREDLGSVFEMFTQVGRNRDRAQGGLGIGLALVRKLVEMHGGTVTADSPGPGQGSTFTVRLPLVDAPSPAPEERREQPEALACCFRVLVVDDNIDAADTLAALLEMEGHTTRVAHDGEEALRTAREFRPQIAFLDIGMPGKDGYEVARAMRADPATRDSVLVALTGWGAQEDRARTRNAGFDHHLTKPAGLQAVEALMAQVEERRQREAQPG